MPPWHALSAERQLRYELEIAGWRSLSTYAMLIAVQISLGLLVNALFADLPVAPQWRPVVGLALLVLYGLAALMLVAAAVFQVRHRESQTRDLLLGLQLDRRLRGLETAQPRG